VSTLILLYFGISLFSTTIGAITGMGGGIIIKPVLDMLGDFDVGSISMLSSITVLGMATVSLGSQLKTEVRPSISMLLPLALGTVGGGIVGSILLSKILLVFRESHVTITQNAILIILIFFVFYYMRKERALAQVRERKILFTMAIGVFLGITSSFLGIGGGPINVAIIVYAFSYTTQMAAWCSLFSIMLSQGAKIVFTTFMNGFSGYDLSMLPFMMLGGIAGGIIGGKVRIKVNSQVASRLFNAAQVIVLIVCITNIYRNIK